MAASQNAAASNPSATVGAPTWPDIQTPVMNVVSQFTGNHNSHSISRPIDVHLDPKTKSKIFCNEFVNFNTLISANSTGEEYNLQFDGSTVSLVPKNRIQQIRTMDQWTEAFHIFVSVYIQAHPGETQNLMKYAHTIQSLFKQSGFAAAMSYDTSFRRWRQQQPSLLWEVVNAELFLHASTISLGKVQPVQGQFQGPFRGNRPTMANKNRCWSFAKNGTCPRGSACRFQHLCTPT